MKEGKRFYSGFCCFCPETVSSSNKTQVRGGQDCSLKADPADSENQKYKVSAHCLHFIDVWFTVSALTEPIVLHSVFLQVFNQQYLVNGSSVWISVTHDEEFELSPQSPTRFDENKTIATTFYTANPKSGTVSIASEENRLLIPQPMLGVDHNELPPIIKNGASDYLLLSKSIIEPQGTSCDHAGVSYEAFVKQQNRCSVTKNTCLKNQPLDFWKSDDERRKLGQKGQYLLENYGVPSEEPIAVDHETNEHWLVLEYYAKQLTVLTIEMNADNIIALRPGLDIQISNVISVVFRKSITMHVRIRNSGLSPSFVSVKCFECEYDVPDCNNLTMLIPPQKMLQYKLATQRGSIELDKKFHCSVVVTTKFHGVIAKRKITLKPFQKCICYRHCECVCFGELLKCQPLEIADFHEAGFVGSLPLLVAKPPKKSLIRAHPKVTLAALLLLLLLIGFFKAVVGLLYSIEIRNLGLKSRIYRSKKMKRYFDPELKDMKVTYDEDGFPVNPINGHPAETLSDNIIFLLNTLFCFVFPCIKLSNLCIKEKTFTPTETTEQFEEEEERLQEFSEAQYETEDPIFTIDDEEGNDSDGENEENYTSGENDDSLVEIIDMPYSQQTNEDLEEFPVDEEYFMTSPEPTESPSDSETYPEEIENDPSTTMLAETLLARPHTSDSVLERVPGTGFSVMTKPMRNWKKGVGMIGALSPTK